MAEKLFLGAKLRKLREARGWTLEACAERLGLSPSYLSQLETNQRPATARVLIALTRAFHVDASLFDLEGDARLLADLREATTDIAGPVSGEAEPPTAAELKQAVVNTPRLARQFLALHQTFRRLDERVKALDDTLGRDERGAGVAVLPFEEVRDFFHYRDNYIDSLDTAAERLAAGLPREGQIERSLEAALGDIHGVRVVTVGGQEALRRYDPVNRVLTLDAWRPGATRTFQMAHQLALLSFREQIEAELDQAAFRTDAARDVARIGLANYAAGATLLPYKAFLEAAREERHDIDRLRTRFQVSFEQVCHRLSNLQRPGWRGVPFYFARVDMAGNITKRHSATRFQFARFGGACPLWNVHEAFAAPDRIDVQLAEMPDGSRYVSIAKSVSKPSGSYLANDRRYALSLGCEVEHAPSLIYSAGLDLNGPATKIGVSCRICERTDCTQRAFPPIDRTLEVPENERGVVPYRFGSAPAQRFDR
ncbi:MAG: short-chain fatty acyl-CoA regulator family protein [Brevundimonas sp.]|uniref:helix-turn-helix domain-containing protein n=1 Tax=Brevundimonas sp. TaxID=1871086 RepID=UPI002582E36E|nr:short-chain fatty acyl-CoA regulator family protein [Brevundimonas sp.]MCV0415915.1 short-chain fatty acyl-CoA regulator family protein [Brevundimonas sp.]